VQQARFSASSTLLCLLEPAAASGPMSRKLPREIFCLQFSHLPKQTFRAYSQTQVTQIFANDMRTLILTVKFYFWYLTPLTDREDY
jgi:hypothetical protein